MKQKTLWAGLGACLGMLILILDGKTALIGAQRGVQLCLITVIPSLFPFFVLSILLNSTLSGFHLPFLKEIGHFCGIPTGSEPLLISGFLGGYPVGAQGIAETYKAGQLSRQTAQRMLAFCNNAGPAFLFGMVASFFPESWMVWNLWVIHISGALFTAMILPGATTDDCTLSMKSVVSANQIMVRALSAIGTVCGWIIVFRVVVEFLQRWILFLFPIPFQVAVTGMLELSNGCCFLPLIENVDMRFILCAGMLAFGGLCVTMQTISVSNGLSIRHYLLGKFIQTGFSVTAALAIVSEMTVFFFAAVLLLVLILRKDRKSSSIPNAAGV